MKAKSDEKVCIPFTTFQIVEYFTKKVFLSEHLKPVEKKSSLHEIVAFAESILPKIINHWNHSHHYSISLHSFRDNFDALCLDIDFSKNVSIPVKSESQLVHWHKDSIIKLHGKKSYHPYDKHCNQKFVKVVLKEMIESVYTILQLCIIESSNCGAQYKSAEHFDDVQNLADHFDIPITHVFSIAGQGKREVDHVSGLAKCTIRRYVGTGEKSSMQLIVPTSSKIKSK